jgi:cytochrome b subunit of formate dehydrogenase
MKFTITRRIGSLLLAVWLILTGLSGFGLSFPGEGAILALLAIGAGIFILLER